MLDERSIDELRFYLFNYYIPEHWDLNHDYFNLNNSDYDFDLVMLCTGKKVSDADRWFRVNEKAIEKIAPELPDLESFSEEDKEDDSYYIYMDNYIEDNKVIELLCNNNIMKYHQVFDEYCNSYHYNDKIYEIPYQLLELISRALWYYEH